MTLQVAMQPTGTVMVAALSGELALSKSLDQTVGSLLAALDQAVAEGRCDVVLDLAGLRFVDSAGLRVVLRVRAAVLAAGGRLVLAALRPGVMQILDIAGLNQHLTLYPTVEEAVSALR
ncbi:STAS domain-containing protein [Actinomadura kijaniata]|uniref:STAS domain-containing protein n=1 Tax=Actinomadura kijaniata TaxID=46161 RepID=UPI003F1B575B